MNNVHFSNTDRLDIWRTSMSQTSMRWLERGDLPMTAIARILLAGAALSFAPAAALAQDCPTVPTFVGVTAPNSDVRASNTRINREDWRVAEHFAREALESRTSARNKTAAAINLCAALANQGSADAADACDDAVTRGGERWEAYTNRGAALWLAGDTDAAAADFAAAAEMAGDEDAEAIINNSALASCAS
jgi:hypothetical protein